MYGKPLTPFKIKNRIYFVLIWSNITFTNLLFKAVITIHIFIRPTILIISNTN